MIEETLPEDIPFVCDWLFGPHNTSLLAPSGIRGHCLTPRRPVSLHYMPWKTNVPLNAKTEADQPIPKDISKGCQTLPPQQWQRLTLVTLP